jgi:hypothetical protein
MRPSSPAGASVERRAVDRVCHLVGVTVPIKASSAVAVTATTTAGAKGGIPTLT